MSERPTYGDISRRTAEHAVRGLLAAARTEIQLTPPTRWQRFRRLFSVSLWRWRLSERFHDLAYWIEP